MSPKEKAFDLYDKFREYAQYDYFADKEKMNAEIKENTKACALIAVDNELNFLIDKFDAYKVNDLNQLLHDRINYLEEVKKEIQSLYQLK